MQVGDRGAGDRVGYRRSDSGVDPEEGVRAEGVDELYAAPAERAGVAYDVVGVFRTARLEYRVPGDVGLAAPRVHGRQAHDVLVLLVVPVYEGPVFAVGLVGVDGVDVAVAELPVVGRKGVLNSGDYRRSAEAFWRYDGDIGRRNHREDNLYGVARGAELGVQHCPVQLEVRGVAVARRVYCAVHLGVRVGAVVEGERGACRVG